MGHCWKISLVVLIVILTTACSDEGSGSMPLGPSEMVEMAPSDNEAPTETAPNDSISADEPVSDGTEETEEWLPLMPGDVSFLIPLRALNDFGAGSSGGYGTLLPRSFYDQFEALTRVDEIDEIYRNLDVVGVRLDPCFVEGKQVENCGSQVRVVLQPIIGGVQDYVARDATLHAFYEVPRSELNALAQSIARLRSDGGGSGDIGQHPQAVSVSDLLLPSLGAERLSRITFVSVHASDQAWSFGGFDVIDGALSDHHLFSVDDHEQHLTSLGGTENLDASIFPEPVIETEAARFMEFFLRDEMSPEEKESAHMGLRRLLDPSVHDTGTVDCASCHMATTAAYFVDGRLGLDIPDVYANTQNQRMFGYFGTEESISPRVHAETQLVLEAFDRFRAME